LFKFKLVKGLFNPYLKTTELVERLFKSDKAFTSMARVIEEWKTLLEIMTMEHEEDVRLGLSASGAMMKID